ncbi:hypothetical protein Tsubulata_007009 [Turnera subulata]|uniref:Pectinesterase catalytic domain-containing protein n=1 Tax=Turnera subulata TaxID=218843 RepID=A0A9Q0IX53_9ROSI|nr:hypothetical protein Tsubulata_007009 [Turnera subulata]
MSLEEDKVTYNTTSVGPCILQAKSIDIIFGRASVVVQNCNIYVRRLPNKTKALTAHGKEYR